MKKDFLDELMEMGSRQNPDFPRMVEEAMARRELARRLAAERERSGFSQTTVAARMGTSQSIVSKLEGGADVKVSTLQRYCRAIGRPLNLAAIARGGARRRSSARRRQTG